MSKVLEVSSASFTTEVLQSPMPVMVDFWAPWCGPCRMLAPAVEAAEQELEGKVKVVKVNVDDAQGLALQFGVQSIPTIVFFKDGKQLNRLVGLQTKETLIKQALSL